MTTDPTAELDSRFSDPEAGPTPWSDAARVLEHAELYWLTTVRNDGRPHVTPLIGVAEDGAMHFCTGLREQKARNLEHRRHVVLTTGNNTWAQGLDVVVEGTASRVADHRSEPATGSTQSGVAAPAGAAARPATTTTRARHEGGCASPGDRRGARL